MKGLSPFIAAIMLIAFTVAVGGIISIFLTGFFKSSTSSVGSGSSTLIACSGSSPTVDLVKYAATLSGNTTNVTFSNPGANPLINVVVYVIMSNSSVLPSSGSGAPVGSLGSLATNATSIATYNGSLGIVPTEVRVVGICNTTAGNQSVSGSCLAGSSCMVGV